MMAMYSNAQKLAAVLNKWAQPAIQGLLGTRLGQLPFIANIDAKLRSTGWVSPMWSISKEISPLLDGLSSSLVEPMLARYLQGIPDEAIPELAHKVVEDAIRNGGLSLFEGKVEFETDDLEELRTLLRYNLPVPEKTGSYEVLTEEPIPQGDDVDK
ncbi:MAG: hypothetical protein BHV67_06810 [Bacteroidales bacterium 43_36]|jgi:hypothetical protein|nr:MAG: hypothetical protein BHV67_06810 [Bacteroidales bacterium 43_36]UVX37915.1 MAG: hypothetical protein [Bacteriophage sp.]DAV39453.1 MAG TPA: hypothetical protein [Caudoviricetes sp.]UVY06755.1 MAG: hypothetical protein [Bacteriophage sp.]UWD65228.1 MAG: hypothetical protein [Bacteriophage sp.]